MPISLKVSFHEAPAVIFYWTDINLEYVWPQTKKGKFLLGLSFTIHMTGGTDFPTSWECELIYLFIYLSLILELKGSWKQKTMLPFLLVLIKKTIEQQSFKYLLC